MQYSMYFLEPNYIVDFPHNRGETIGTYGLGRASRAHLCCGLIEKEKLKKTRPRLQRNRRISEDKMSPARQD